MNEVLRVIDSIVRGNLCERSPVKPSYQSVSDCYAGKCVFITGATGFIGKVLLERLLYTCKDLETVYILIRPKKSTTLQQRLQELLRNPVFTKLKETRYQDLSKIVPIAGDVGDARLGMNLDDEQTLIKKVSVVFHSAANIRFNAPLYDLMRVNYEGTKNIMELAKKMKKLDVFVHVSTSFYRNSRDLIVDEITERPPRNIEHVYKVIADHSNEPNEIKKLNKELKLDEWGNNYLFSKHMSEAYVASNYDKISALIVRPSLVSSVYKEPLVGYTDFGMAATTFLGDVASGLTRIVYGSKSVVADIIPVDYVCNFLIVAASKNIRSTKCNAYNISSGHSNPITWAKLAELYIRESKKHGYEGMPFPKVYFTKVRWVVHVLKFLCENVPTFTADTWLRLTGRQPKYIKLQKRATSRYVYGSVLTISSWDIRTTQARELLATLNDEDRRTFSCDPASIDWDKYVPIYCKGVKDYTLSNKNK